MFLQPLLIHTGKGRGTATAAGKMDTFSTSAAHLSLGWRIPEPLTVTGSATAAEMRTQTSTLLLHQLTIRAIPSVAHMVICTSVDTLYWSDGVDDALEEEDPRGLWERV